MRKPTIRLDLRASHDLPQRHVAGYVHAIPILSFGKLAGHFASLGGPGLFTSKRNMDQKRIYGPSGPKSSMVDPSMGSTTAPGTFGVRGGKEWASLAASTWEHERRRHPIPR